MMLDDHIIEVARGTWGVDDARADVQGTVVIGRAHVRIDGDRYCIDALVVASTDSRNLGARFATFFDPDSGRLVAIPMEVS